MRFLAVICLLVTGYGLAQARTVPTLIEKLNTTHRSGYGEALATDGVHVLVGATGSGSRNEVRVYKRNPGAPSFSLSGVIEPPVASVGQVSSFGRAVSVDGSLVAVGGIESGQGAVYLYIPDPFALGRWLHVRTLTNFNTDWGTKLDLSGMLLAIGEHSLGAPGEIHLHRSSQGGPNNWGLVKTVRAPALPGGVLSLGDDMGANFDLSGNRLVAAKGENGILEGRGGVSDTEVYIFEANTGGTDQWGLQHTITPGSVGASVVGTAVAMDGGRLVFSGRGAGGLRKIWFFDAAGAAWSEAGTFEIPAAVTPLVAESFGLDLALSGDDAMVSYFDHFTAPNLRHMVTVFRRSGGSWGIVRVRSAGILLDDAHGAEEAHLRRAFSKASMAMRNGVLVFNALKDVGSDAVRSGMVSVRVRDDGGANSWGEVNRLLPPTSWRPEFGASMAAAGNYLVVGDPGDDEGGIDSGAVFWFERRVWRGAEEWHLLRKIKPDTPEAGARFGTSVDIHVGSFTQIVIGAPGQADGGGIYRYASGSGVFDPGLRGPFYMLTKSPGDEAGAAVAVSENFVAVGSPNDGDGVAGAPGSVTVYRRIGTTGFTGSRILRATGTIDTGDRFGASLAMWGDYLAVGAPNDEGGGTVHVYEYDRTAESWDLVREISLGTGSLAQFGRSLDLDGGYLAVGAPGLFSGRGQAYLYLKDSFSGSTSGWGFVSAFLAPATSGFFGGSVALGGGNLLVGARDDSTRTTAEGAAYLYRARSGSGGLIWDREAQLFGNVPATGYRFGEAVAVMGSSLIVSSLQDDAGTVNHGAAYVYRAGSYERWVGNTNLDLKAPDAFGLLDDPDDDGQCNLEEFAYGSDPCNPGSRGRFAFSVRSGPAGPLIRAAEVAKPAHSTAGLKREFTLSMGLNYFRPSRDAFVLEDSGTRFAVDFIGLVIAPGPPAQGKQFIRLEFTYPED